jgi:hypothetical protein
MEYQIRKIERDTIYLKSEVAHLDPEQFRDIEYEPYTGDGSKEDFLQYICDISTDVEFLEQFENASCYGYSSEEEIKKALVDKEIDQQEADAALKALKIVGVFDELVKLMGDCVHMEQYASSSKKGENSNFELGVEDPSYKKTGGFNVVYIIQKFCDTCRSVVTGNADDRRI